MALGLDLNDLDLPGSGTILLRMLEERNLAQHSVQEIIDQFQQEFSTQIQKYSACSVIVYFLKNPEYLEGSAQKIAANILLLRAYGKGAGTLISNPFASVIYTLLMTEDETKQNGNSPRTVAIEEKETSIRKQEFPHVCLSELEKRLISSFVVAEASSEIWLHRLSSLMLVEKELQFKTSPPDLDLSELIVAKDKHGELVAANKESGLRVLKDSKNFREIETSYSTESLQLPLRTDFPAATVKPPPLYVAQDELMWLNIEPSMGIHELELLSESDFPPSEPEDEEVDVSEPVNEIEEKAEESVPEPSIAIHLIQHAFKEALSITQRQELLNELKTNPEIVHELQVTPEILPDLVESNPIVATEVLLRMIDSSSDMKDHLTALIQMDMSVHSMEVVNRLTTSVELPKEFLYLYISNCIKTCEGIQDKYVQNRLVRLLCVFLQSLIRSQIIDFQCLYIEILSFCVEFSRIREAAALYKLMKQVESEDPELGEVLSKKLELHQHLSEAAKNFPSKDKDANYK